MRFGIRCVIAPSFADIFYDNAFQNGLLPLALPAAEHAALADAVTQAKEPVVTVDLERCVLRALTAARLRSLFRPNGAWRCSKGSKRSR